MTFVTNFCVSFFMPSIRNNFEIIVHKACATHLLYRYNQEVEWEANPNEKELSKIRLKSPQYTLEDIILCRRFYLQPLLWCVAPTEANYLILEFLKGSCSSHIGSRSIAKKIMYSGYYWLRLFSDVSNLIQKCSKCQVHAPVCRQP